MKFDGSRVEVGMTAFSTRGEKLGKVLRCGDQEFVVEKGLLFPRDYLLRYEYVTSVRNGNVFYALDDLRLAELDPLLAAADAAVHRAAARASAKRSP
jgi:hypothetical protein